MKRMPTLLLFGTVVALLGAAGYGLYHLGMSRGMNMSGGAGSESGASGPDLSAIARGEAATRRHIEAGIKAGQTDPKTGKRILYYHDPMVPGRRFDVPGKSPFMDMMLVPQYAGAEADAGTVSVSPRIAQNLGLRTKEVVLGELSPHVKVVGNVAWNERLLQVMQARATGFVEKLHVRATLDRVVAGAPVLDLYVPDWVAAQEEFLAVRRMQGEGMALVVDAARARMRQAGMSEAQIARVERSDALQPRVTLVAPIGGVLTELMAREGMTVTAGVPLARINGTSTVWAHAEVPESQAALVRVGALVEAHTAEPGSAPIVGHVQAVLPEVNATTRTVKVRIELPNAKGELTPGQFVTVALGAPSMQGLSVPSEAIIATGTRSLVMLAEGHGKYRPVEVLTGISADGRTEIKRGLEAGQQVVVSGQFLLDSEASLRAVETRDLPARSVPAMGATP